MDGCRAKDPLDHEHEHVGALILCGWLFVDVCCWLCVTWWLVSDIRWRARSSPLTGHDIAGPGLHVDLLIAQVRRKAVFRSGNVAPDQSPIEKQAAAGQWPGPGRLRCNEP